MDVHASKSCLRFNQHTAWLNMQLVAACIWVMHASWLCMRCILVLDASWFYMHYGYEVALRMHFTVVTVADRAILAGFFTIIVS